MNTNILNKIIYNYLKDALVNKTFNFNFIRLLKKVTKHINFTYFIKLCS